MRRVVRAHSLVHIDFILPINSEVVMSGASFWSRADMTTDGLPNSAVQCAVRLVQKARAEVLYCPMCV